MVDTGGPTTCSVIAFVVAPIPSCSSNVKLEVPRVVGVPNITPVEVFRLRPIGRAPLMIAQGTGITGPPPEYVNVPCPAGYATPIPATGIGVADVMRSCG